jgi:CheY-like chemotaxis protein/two-component sensor histidine kinase
MVGMIDRQVAQMARLIDDLLDVSRMTRGMFDLLLERCDFGEIAAAAVEACREEMASRGHTLRVSMPKEPIAVRADRHRLLQVFCNLIVNAAKYTPAGGQIEFIGRTAGSELEVLVKDSGIGIPPNKLQEIFELFAQVDRSLERQGGLGVGLTLARELIELHHGTIEARSAGVGQGSTFIVRLPISGAEPVRVSADGEQKPGAEPRRILIADDNEDAADSLALILRAEGHEVRVVFDGEAAFRVCGEFKPEVVFLDIGMPKLNGYEVARRVRSEAWGKPIQLAALTGWGQEDDRRRSAEAGFNTHFVKPVSSEALLKFLADLGRTELSGTVRSA